MGIIFLCQQRLDHCEIATYLDAETGDINTFRIKLMLSLCSINTHLCWESNRVSWKCASFFHRAPELKLNVS